MESQKVLVVGSGLVGALLARVLAERGHEVSLFERRPDLRRVDISAGRSINLALSARGFRALAQVSLEQRVREMAIPMRGRRLHAKDGTLGYQPYGKEDQAIYSVSRGGLNAVLMDHAEAHDGVKIYFDQRCVEADLDAPAIVVEDGQTQARTRHQGDVLFGADGAFSAIRHAMMMRPRFNYAQTYETYGYKELTIPPRAGDGDDRFRIEKNALHIWPRGGFMLIALPNLDGSFTVTLFLPYEGERSFERLQTPTDVERFFAEEFPDALAVMPTLAEDFFQNPTGDLATMRCGPWHYRERACLIGDAAHAIVPFYGQGMNAGFEDCRVLGDLLDGAGERSLGSLLATFAEDRKPNADAIADLALMNFVEMRDRVADPRFLLQKQIEARIHELFGDQYLTLYSMVSFSHLPYAQALREGRAHDQLMEKILAVPGIEDIWHSDKGDTLLRQAVSQSLSERT